MKNSDNNFSLARAMDLYRESEYSVAVSDFLTPGEKITVYKDLTARIGNGISGCFFWGGCRGTERCAAVFLPEWYLPDGAPIHSMPSDDARTDFFAEYLAMHPEISEKIPLRGIKISGSGFRTLSHRDFMGGILSLGVSRSVVGDIAVISESEAFVIVHERIAAYIDSELTKIGRDGVKTEIVPLDPMYMIPRRYSEEVITVSSPRLDGIVKAITGKSRETAADMVRSGLVELSYEQTDNVSAVVRAGDILSIRGFGKYVVGDTTGETKSGRLKIKMKKYV